jgi:hypothetical protein
MIEAIIAAGVAGAVTVLARSIHHNTSVNHYTESEIKDRIRRMADNRLKEYKEQGKISEHEYILLLNKRYSSNDTIKNQTVNSGLDTNTVITSDNEHKCSYSNFNHYQDLGSNTYTIITTMNKILSRLDDIYSKLNENNSSLNNGELKRRLNLGKGKYSNSKVHQNKSVTKIKEPKYNSNDKEKSEGDSIHKEGDINTNYKEERLSDYIAINTNYNTTINDNNNNDGNEFNDIEELKKQIADMISKLEKE